jgi:hypothetical protein
MRGPLSSPVDDLVRRVGPARCVSLAACLMRPGLRPRTTFYPCWPLRGQAPHPVFASWRIWHALGGRAPLLTGGRRCLGPGVFRAPSTSFALTSWFPVRVAPSATVSASPRPGALRAQGTARARSTASGRPRRCPLSALGPRRGRSAPDTSGSIDCGAGAATSTTPFRWPPPGCAGSPPC